MGVFFGIVIILAIGLAIQFFVSRASEAVERKIRSGAVSSEDELLHTVVTLKTSAALSEVRKAVADTVLVKSSIRQGAARIIADSDKGILWEFGLIQLKNGFQAQLVYSVTGSVTTGAFSITNHVMKDAVSPFIGKMTELRNQVITAFQSVDADVEVTTSRQTMTKTRG